MTAYTNTGPITIELTNFKNFDKNSEPLYPLNFTTQPQLHLF